MNQEKHLSMARELIRRADQESGDGGNDMIAAEFLWGALAQCLIAIAQNDGLPHDSHGAFLRTAQYLDTTQEGNIRRCRFGSAERLHHYFYHGDLPDAELRTHRRRTREAILELLRVL